MKITQAASQMTEFDEIEIGDVFEARGAFYMKIYENANSNAIDLSDGSTDYFCSTDVVVRVDCELVIK